MNTVVDAKSLTNIPIFTSLGPEDLEQLCKLWKSVTRNEGALLFKKGDPGNAMYVIREGEVAITIWTEDNQEKVLSILKKGDFLGELALLDGSTRSASAKIRKHAVLLEMTRDDFFQFLRSRPSVAITMMGVMAERLRKTNEMMEQSTARNVNVEAQQHASLSDKLAAKISGFIGTWEFLFVFFVLYSCWILINVFRLFIQPVDPYPFNFINFMLASLTAIQAPIILMSQNRQSEIERLRSELDYQTNVKAELQIQSLHVKIDELRASEIHDLTQVQRDLHGQIAALKHQMEQVRNNK